MQSVAIRGIQLHPTRQCNLRCLHCYSSSAPEERDHLPLSLLQAALDDACAEGYNLANVSGGEPLLYKPLPALLSHAHTLGMRTTLTTNGMLLDAKRVSLLQGRVDMLAISLDGVPVSHNRMRASERAFEAMQSRLEGVRQAGISFGFLFTLTQHNLHELEWVVRFAVDQGARLLHIHPLEATGRAQSLLPSARPDMIECAYSFIEVQRLQELFGEQITIHLDLAHRETIRAFPERVFAADEIADVASLPLADLVAPLMIEADAMVSPIGYGFAREYALGSLHEASLRELAARWRRERYPAFHQLCRSVYANVVTASGLPFLNWYEELAVAAADVMPRA